MRVLRQAGFALGLLLTPALLCAQEVTFDFDPPSGIQFVQTLKRTSALEETGPKGTTQETEEIEQKTRISIWDTLQGYRAVFTPIILNVVRNGKPVVNDAVTRAVMAAPITYDLDLDGRIVRVSGDETIVAKLKESLPPQTARLISAAAMDKTLLRSHYAEWKDRFGMLIGVKAKMGDMVTVPDDAPALLCGDGKFYRAAQLMDRVRCGDHDCIRLRLWSTSDEAVLSKVIERSLNQTAVAGRTVSASTAPSIEKTVAQGERLIDPATMLVYAEKRQRTLPGDAPAPAGRQNGTLRVTEEYTFDYDLPRLPSLSLPLARNTATTYP